MPRLRDYNRILVVAVLSLIINGILFTGLPNLLSRERPHPDLETIQAVDFLREPTGRQAERPPDRPDEPPPEPPRVVPQRTIASIHEERPMQPRMDMPAFDLAANTPDMALGVPVTAPAARPVAIPVLKDHYGMAEVDQAPTATVRSRPVYPYRARRLNLDGQVDVKFLVDTTGRVSRISILRSSPPEIFDDSVVTALAGWRFSPGMLRGRPVNTWVTTTIEFKINDL